MKFSRRSFLKGCCGTAAALAGGHISGLAFGAPGRPRADAPDLYVNVFLRGGADGLNLVVPYADDNYITKRPNILIPAPGEDNGALDLDRGFGLHPSAPGLHQLYLDGKVAFVVASGSPDPSRSHFDAQDAMEKGTPGRKDLSTGWLARHLQTAGPSDGVIPVLVTTSEVPTSLIGSEEVAALSSSSALRYEGYYQEIEAQRVALRRLYAGTHWMQEAGSAAMDIMDRIAGAGSGVYTNPPFDTDPNDEVGYLGGFGDALRTIVRIQSLDLGLRIAAVDLGGWDTHENQPGTYANNVRALSRNLQAFYLDMLRFTDKFTLCVMSEFGRRLKENASEGTDHGHGNNLIVVSPHANRGVYGEWPGLANDVLDEGQDVPVLNDYRQVLGEILNRRMQNPALPTIFPHGPEYAPYGVVQGVDLPITSPAPEVPAVQTGLAVAAVGVGVGAAMAWRERRMAENQASAQQA